MNMMIGFVYDKEPPGYGHQETDIHTYVLLPNCGSFEDAVNRIINSDRYYDARDFEDCTL